MPVSYSWVDPHFAAHYARREEERLAERLAALAEQDRNPQERIPIAPRPLKGRFAPRLV